MFSFSLAQSFAIYFRTFSILDSTQKISIVTDSRKYRFSFFHFQHSAKIGRENCRKNGCVRLFCCWVWWITMVRVNTFWCETLGCCINSFPFPTPTSTWYAKELVSNLNCKWIENTLINHSSVQSEYSSRSRFFFVINNCYHREEKSRNDFNFSSEVAALKWWIKAILGTAGKPYLIVM